MAQATEKQVRELEKALGEQFFLLVQSAEFRINLARKVGLNNPVFVKYSNEFYKLVIAWWNKEVKYEKAVYAKTGIKGILFAGNIKTPKEFLYSEQLPKLIDLVKKWNAERTQGREGMGFVPLIIWAVIAIVSAFSATVIVDDLTTTAEEKEKLLQTTAQTIKDLNLTPEQASALISQTQAEAGGSGSMFGDLKTLAMWGIGGYVVIKVVLPAIEGKKAA